MKYTIYAFIPAVTLAFGLSGPVAADDYAGKGQFESYDQNHDGVVSKDELGPQHEEFLSKYDEDSDGQLSEAEFSAFEESEDWTDPAVGPGGVHIDEGYESERN